MQLIENASNEKLRGAYYTPREIASFILRWGVDGNHCANILEPSCGDGAFLRCIQEEGVCYKSIVAVEYDEAEAQKAAMIPLRHTEVLNGDFHQFCLNQDKRFDLVVGNPPFIRYQYYKQEQQNLADEIFQKVGMKRSKLTNAWVSFVVGCAQLLTDNGKLGFVVPSEILQVSYAKQLRKYLAECFNKINIISFENLVFAEIQQDVVLLLCEKDNTGNHLIDHIELKDSMQLADLCLDKLSRPTKSIDFHSDKWTYYFLDKEELSLINKAKRMERMVIADYADVEVGITTGANDFFTVPENIVNAYQLHDFARPMVGRSVQVNSLRFTQDDWRKNVAAQAKAYMLVFTPDAKQTGNDGVKAYLENGEKEGINRGYKTGIRDDWYVIPSIKLSEAMFLRRNYMYPKFVLNEAKAYTTDTMHRVFIHEGVKAKAFIASYYNSLSFAFTEILGRNYGGGCLELMPSEASHVFIPYDERNEDIFDTIDAMLRQNKSADEILDVTDNVLLQERMGFTAHEISLARSIWHKIMGKRLNRQQVKTIEPKKIEKGNAIIKQLDMFETLKRYPELIVNNVEMVNEADSHPSNTPLSVIDDSKHVLVSLVKEDNTEQYLDRSAQIYYSGKKFPSTVSLDNLYYFMPYFKKKGIRDLYLIRKARIGNRKEGQSGCDATDYRLVFEIKFICQLYEDYKPVDLHIWHTFTDTTLNRLTS